MSNWLSLPIYSNILRIVSVTSTTEYRNRSCLPSPGLGCRSPSAMEWSRATWVASRTSGRCRRSPIVVDERQCVVAVSLFRQLVLQQCRHVDDPSACQANRLTQAPFTRSVAATIAASEQFET